MKRQSILVLAMAVVGVLLNLCGSAHASLQDGLVVYHPFNGNANDETRIGQLKL